MSEFESTFLKFGIANWWKIREEFKRKAPKTVTASYLATVLSQEEKSVKTNILPPLRRMGLIDEKGKPTELAYDWRDDEKYPEVCKKIVENNYLQELRDLSDSDKVDDRKIKDWFARYGKVGETAASMMSAFYRLLLRADPQEFKSGKEANSTRSKKETSKNSSRKPTAKATPKASLDSKSPQEHINPEETKASAHVHNPREQAPFGSMPQLHINIQLHISPESTSEQIEKIFESMAKHLKELNR